MVFPLVQPSIRPTSGFAWFFSKVSVLAVIGLLQTMIAIVIVKFALGLQLQNLGATFLLALISSYTFIALVQMFVSMFKDPGRYVVLILMVIQLTTCAGTFPLELIPKPLQFFNNLLPVTYTVRGFRAAISTGDMSYWTQNVFVLLAFMACFLFSTCLLFIFLYKKHYAKEAAAE